MRCSSDLKLMDRFRTNTTPRAQHPAQALLKASESTKISDDGRSWPAFTQQWSPFFSGSPCSGGEHPALHVVLHRIEFLEETNSLAEQSWVITLTLQHHKSVSKWIHETSILGTTAHPRKEGPTVLHRKFNVLFWLNECSLFCIRCPDGSRFDRLHPLCE